MDFKNDLLNNLSSINIKKGLTCSNVNCNSPNHRADIDKFTTDVLSSVENATYINIPPLKAPHQKTIPGWTEFVKPFKDDACFWHAIWV